MSTPMSKEDQITLPEDKSYRIVIDSDHFPAEYAAQLNFNKDPGSDSWSANFSVPSVFLTEMNCPVTDVDGSYQFGFMLENATGDQKKAGYVDGHYKFSFLPPGSNPPEFAGTIDDPWLDHPKGAVDTFTATGNDPEEAASY